MLDKHDLLDVPQREEQELKMGTVMHSVHLRGGAVSRIPHLGAEEPHEWEPYQPCADGGAD